MKEVASLSASKPRLKRNKVNGGILNKPLIALAITAVCFVLMCISGQVYPFGTETILISDLEAQYAPFLFLYKNLISSAHSVSDLFYSFNLGAGKNMMGTIGYYLGSPWNLLVFLFSSKNVSSFIILLIGIKISLASFFMTLFIESRQENKSSYICILFGILYSFSSYAMMFMFQIMWLDGFYLLPLLLFFVDKYRESGKTLGLIVTLLLLFISNYYIAYMVGIFSFFYLIVRMIDDGSFKNRKVATSKILKFICAAILCGMTLAVVLVPVGLDTIMNSDPTHSEASARYMNFAVIDLIDQMFSGTPGEFADVMISNLPFIFINTFVTLSVVILFVSSAFAKRDKVKYGIILGLIYCSLAITLLDEAWQVFDSPNWFYHRETFVFYPVFFIIALKVYEKITEIKNKEIIKSAAILIALLVVAQSFGEVNKRDKVFLFSLFIIILISGILMLYNLKKWPKSLENMPKIVPPIFSIILVFESAFMFPVLSEGLSTFSVHYGAEDEYYHSVEVLTNLSEFSEGINQGFRTGYEAYGTEDALEANENLSFYTPSRTINLFNSNSNKSFHHFLKQLGYTSNYNYFSLSYGFAAEDTDAFLSIGTVILNSDYSGATLAANGPADDHVYLYQNEEVLPIAFTARSSALDFDFYRLESDLGDKNYLEFRNDWYNSLFGDTFSEPFYYDHEETLEPEYINASSVNLGDYINDEPDEEDKSDESSESAVFDRDDIGFEVDGAVKDSVTLYRMNSELPIIINYNLTAQSSDELYMNLSVPVRLDECDVYVNGDYMGTWLPSSFYSFVIRLGAFEEGENVQVTITSNSKKFEYQSVNFAYMNSEIFASQFQNIENRVTVNEVRNGYVSMTADIRDGEMILTSIPYERGWKAYVDGANHRITSYQDALIAIECNPGTYNIELRFTPPGLKEGGIISVIGIVGLIAFGIISKKSAYHKDGAL